MKELLEKYKNGTLTTVAEQEAFVSALLSIRAQRLQDSKAMHTPNEGIIVTLKFYLQKMNTLKFVAIAASLLLACFAFSKFNEANNDSGNQLMADITVVSKNLHSVETRTRGITSENNYALEAVSELYRKGSFQEIINELDGKNPINETEYLFLGLAYANHQKSNFAAALQCFDKVKSLDYTQDVTMMKAMCHIGLNQKGAARTILESILKEEQYGNEYREKARALLKNLK